MRRLPILLATLILPAMTHASIWTLEYSATLTNRHTQGIDFPELINGTLTFDLNDATDIYDSPHMAYWESDVDQGSNFVQGYQPPGGRSLDFVAVDNGDHPDYPDFQFRDAFNIGDISLAGDTRNAFYLSVEAAAGLNWLNDDSVTAFSFSGDELLPERSSIYLDISSVELNSDGEITTVRPLQEAYYDLDYVRLSAVTTPVPEPGTWMMMLAGLFTLWIFKVRQTAVIKKRA